MKEQKINLFEMIGSANAICITTNAEIKQNGLAIWGAGIALQAAQRWPELPVIHGTYLRNGKNTPFALADVSGTTIVTLPTKDSWRDRSNLTLIVQSCKLLMAMANREGWTTIAMPRPGCMNGRLKWENVQPVISRILDDRFVVCTRKYDENPQEASAAREESRQHILLNRMFKD